MHKIITTEALTKRYGPITALDNLTLQVTGKVVGLLGPNGAGKSTLLRLLMGFTRPTSGRLYMLGLSVQHEALKIHQLVGYMPEYESFIPGMNAVSYVRLAGCLVGLSSKEAIQRTHKVLDFIGMGEDRYRPLEALSVGMRQKVKFAQAIVHDPQLILLDEPTAGLDHRARYEMLEFISEVARRQTHVLISTHILADIERLCDEIIILNHGQLVLYEKFSALENIPGCYEIKAQGDLEGFERGLIQTGLNIQIVKDGIYRVWREPPLEDATFIFKVALETNTQVRECKLAQTSLHQIFIRTLDTRYGTTYSGV